MWCLYVAANMTKCPLTRCVGLQEMSISGGSTVPSFKKESCAMLLTFTTFFLHNRIKLQIILSITWGGGVG